MTFEHEFQKQWTSLCNYLSSEIIKSNNRNIDWNRIQALFENEKRRWFLSGQYNNAWFEKLKRNSPQIAARFENALKRIEIESVKFASKPSPIIVFCAAAAGVALGFGLSKVLILTILPNLSILTFVALTIGGGALGLVVGTTLYSQKRSKIQDELRSVYIKQLEEEGKEISRIVSEAD